MGDGGARNDVLLEDDLLGDDDDSIPDLFSKTKEGVAGAAAAYGATAGTT